MKAHQKTAILVLAGSFCFGIIGCDSTSPGKAGQPSGSSQVKTGGTVVFREAKDANGGGFYGILTDKGGQFEPKNLDPKYRTDGLRISFTGTTDTSHLGDHHWGNPISLASVKSEQ